MCDFWNDMQITLNCGILMARMEATQEFARRERRDRSCWVSPYLLERKGKGRFMTDFENLRSSPRRFLENFRMTVEVFDELVALLKPHLLPNRNTRPQDSIPVEEKIAIIIEYLASGDLQRHVASCYRISKQHFSNILDDVCDAICSERKTEIPEWTQENLTKFSHEFMSRWNFPNCVAAIDGKHVAIRAPPNSGSIFYNYKGFHSIVLLAACDAFYKFTYLDVGAYGSEGDSNILKNSRFGISLANDTFSFPPDTNIGGKQVPYFLVGDDAFPLCKRIIKPFNSKPLSKEDRIFNYRLSRARRCIENAFGILSARWLCLRKVLFCSADHAQKIVTSCCLLHNFLLRKMQPNYSTNSFSGFENRDRVWVPGEWETVFSQSNSMLQNNLSSYRGRNASYGKYIRDILKDYVNSEAGSVPWQDTAAFI